MQSLKEQLGENENKPEQFERVLDRLSNSEVKKLYATVLNSYFC